MTEHTDAQAVADFLLAHPEFFEDNPDLTASLKLSSALGGRTISLQDRQVEVLREKIRQLELKLSNLMRIAKDNDAIIAKLPVGSLIVNATGLGKDAPGSPITDDVSFPEHAIIWELNYRGDLVFLDQAKAQHTARHLQIEDGWIYFIHGWTQVIGEVFDVAIPTEGPVFDEISKLAGQTSGARSK